MAVDVATDGVLLAARALVQAGRTDDAERTYRALLDTQPECVEAMRFLAAMAYARSDAPTVIRLLSRASKLEPRNAAILRELGLAYRAAERLDAARYLFERAIELSEDGNDLPDRVLLASVLELDGRPDLALSQYCRVMIDARKRHTWQSDEGVDPGLRSLVAHAREYAMDGRRALFARTLGALHDAAPDARWDRVDTAVAVYLGERTWTPADRNQRSGFFDVPNIGTEALIATERFSWPLVPATAALAALTDEADACFASFGAAASPSNPAATAVLLRRGIERAALRTCAPRLRSQLASLPLVRILNHGPDAELVRLASGVRSRPQYGQTNSRCRIVVNFSDGVPVDVLAGGKQCRLGPGMHAAVDPSFGYVLANPSDRTSMVLWFDVWHPDLSADEQVALAALIGTAVEFETHILELP